VIRAGLYAPIRHRHGGTVSTIPLYRRTLRYGNSAERVAQLHFFSIPFVTAFLHTYCIYLNI
jgi:hypothetical protein